MPKILVWLFVATAVWGQDAIVVKHRGGGASRTLDKHGFVAANGGAGATNTISINATNGTAVLVAVMACSGFSCPPIGGTVVCTNVGVADGTNTYNLVASVDGATLVNPHQHICIFRVSSWAGGTLTATATDSNATPFYVDIAWASCSGCSGVVDSTGLLLTTSGLQTVTTAGNLTATNEFVYSFYGSATSITWTKGGESTLLDTTGLFFSQALHEYFIGGTSGFTISATATPSGATNNGGAVIVAMK